ncbi:fibronectin type III domain-containing protein [Streptomyces sp. NPDC097610]|uniref:GDSL-type esterase/lipase family protein n=1 Tax=Streptomyces sp. NPDC097610 TaxID=3157227 RepID=UPI00331E42CE
MLCALLVVPFAVLAAGPAQAAPPDRTPFLTWNMQGATSSGQSLWSDYIAKIIENARFPPVVMLQEVGPGVPTSTGLDNPPGTEGNSLVTYVRWRMSVTRTYYMVFLQTNDPTTPGGRVNTIVMSQTEVDEAMVVENNHSSGAGRPAIGIRLGNDWYFSFHALSRSGGPDGVPMLNSIGSAVLANAQAAAQRDGTSVQRRDWTVSADFNRRPTTIGAEPGLQQHADWPRIIRPPGANLHVLASGQPTHRSGRELDYAVTTSDVDPDAFTATPETNNGGSDHQPVWIRPTPTPAGNQQPPYASMPVGGNAVDGPNAIHGGMREPLRCNLYVAQGTCYRLPRGVTRASASDAGTPGFDYVGAVSRGDISDGDNQEEAFPGQNIDQLRQHLVGDLRTYKPNVVLLQLDVANDLTNDSTLTATQEAHQLRLLIEQIHYILPNTMVLVGDPAPSKSPAIRDKMYNGDSSYLAQSSAAITDARSAGLRVRQVPIDFPHDASFVDTTQDADGVPNDNGYQAMAKAYAAQLSSLWQSGAVVAPEEVVVNPADLVVDASGVDDDASSGGNPTTNPPLKVMVVGDSMSEGMEGDWTWRYRLWQWFQDQHVPVDFVGPYRGTKQPDPTGPPAPPRLQNEPPENPSVANPPVSGAYNQGIAPGFDSDHFAVWGRQAAQDKELIGPMVAQYKPDLILFGIGFNDMGWFVSDAHGTLDSVKALVDRARAAKPDVKMAVANVPQRLFIDGRQDLVDKTNQYNALLKDAIPAWSTSASPVKLVDWAAGYACEPTKCSAGYDGLHPNLMGEYQIAYAYARTLNREFGIGQSVPDSIATFPDRPISPVSGLKAESVPSGIKVTWNPVFGARGYTVRYRRVGAADWNEVVVPSNRFDTTWTEDGWTWEYQVRTYNYTDGASAWKLTTATAHPETAPPPPNITTSPNSTGMDVYWDTPTGSHTDSIDRYEVITWDKDVPGAYINSTAVTNNQARIDGLVPGHHYLVAVATWNKAGGGMPGVARSVTIGAGTPSVPTDVTVKSVDATTVQLNWTGSPEAAGYRVWVRNVNAPEGSNTQGPYTTDSPEHQIAFLFPGNWNFEFCITAFNGSLESGKSSCVHVPIPPPSTGGNPPPSISSRKASPPAEGPLLKLGQAIAAQRNAATTSPS